MAKVTACSTLGYPNFPLEAAVRRISARGFRKIEIAEMSSYCNHYKIGQVKPNHVRRLLSEQNLAPIAINYYSGPHKLNEEESAKHWVAIHEKMLIQMQNLNVPLAIVHHGLRTNSPGRQDEVEKTAILLNRLGEFAEGLGIKLALEVPHCYSLCNNLEHTREMFSLIDSRNIRAMLDSSHWGILKYDLSQYFDILGNRLCHIHLRDSAGEDTNDFHQDLERTSGKGEVDFHRLNDELDRFGYQGEVSLEFEYRELSFEEIEAEYNFGIQHLKNCGWTFPSGV